MEKEFRNEDYFDFKKLSIDERFIKINTNNCTYIFEVCKEAAYNNKHIGLIVEPGYGTQSAIRDFIKLMPNVKYYFEVCTASKGLRKTLVDFLQLELPPFINVNQSSEDYLVNALSYYFNNINSKRKRLIALHNFENYSGIKNYGIVQKLSEKLKDTSGMVITLNERKFNQLTNISEKRSDIQKFLLAFDWRLIPPPSPQELGTYCVARGVLGKIIIDKLIKDTSDFRTLNKKINNIKELSIKRGYIKP